MPSNTNQGDEIRQLIDLYTRWVEHDEYHTDCEIDDGHKEFDDDMLVAKLAEMLLAARIDELTILANEKILADVIRPGENDDIFHAVTLLTINVRLGHLRRELESQKTNGGQL